MRKLILFLTLATATLAFAAERENIWDLEVHTDKKGFDQLSVYEVGSKTKKPLMKFTAKKESTEYLDSQEIYFSKFNKTYLLTRWAHGAHGQIMRIFDPTNKHALIETYLTTWPIEVAVLEDRLKLTVAVEKFTGDNEPDLVEKYWIPDGKETKASPSSSPEAPHSP